MTTVTMVDDQYDDSEEVWAAHQALRDREIGEEFYAHTVTESLDPTVQFDGLAYMQYLSEFKQEAQISVIDLRKF